MLLQFAVENFACFAEESLFSMVASADDEHPGHTIYSDAGRKPRILRTAALYGANAHGKTKLIEALRFAQALVVEGTKAGQSLRVDPFRMDKRLRGRPSRFDFVIDYDGSEYSYGFEVDSERIHGEWLFGRPKGREIRYFERTTDTTGRVTVEMGASMAGRSIKQQQFLEFVAQGTRPNQLFLTEAADRNVKQIEPLYRWFRDVLTVISATGRYQPLEIRANNESGFLSFMGDFLRRAGTGIDALEPIQEDLDFDKHLPGCPDTMREEIEAAVKKGATVTLNSEEGALFSICPSEDGNPVLVRLKTLHTGRDGSRARFDFAEESSGTQRLMDVLPVLVDVRNREKVYVIDELDRKLHPLLSRLFVSSYLDCGGECGRGQLIFTTHDSHLLDLGLLRRDEIWFLQKDEFGASALYSLADLKVRPDLKIEKGYLNGRFGGIPLIQPTIPAGVSDSVVSSH